jgi:hypothetical protein
MAKYRVWFNRQKAAPGRVMDALWESDSWVVQEKDMGLQTAPGVTIQTEVSFVTGLFAETPQGWAECEGQASRDGQSNFIVIRPL